MDKEIKDGLIVCIYTASQKKKSSSLYITALTGFSKPEFVLKYCNSKKKNLQHLVSQDLTLL